MALEQRASRFAMSTLAGPAPCRSPSYPVWVTAPLGARDDLGKRHPLVVAEPVVPVQVPVHQSLPCGDYLVRTGCLQLARFSSLGSGIPERGGVVNSMFPALFGSGWMAGGMR